LAVVRPEGARRGLSSRLLPAFALLSLALLGTVVWALVKEARAEWRVWQERFAALAPAEAGNASAEDEARGVQQIWLRDLDRVDRCTTCHLGIARPEMKDAAQPFRTHPGRWLEIHRPDRYGCTSCHGGQGEATTHRGAAHRPLSYWPEPMASRELMEARCGGCHKERRPKGTDWLARGRALMADRNCTACHEVPGHDVAEVRAPRLDGLPRKVGSAWLRGWLKKPKGYLPKSRMGDFRLAPADVEALTAFLLLQQQTALKLDSVDWRRADPEQGGEIFRRSRCVTCHELEGRGGTLGPDLTHIGAKVSRDWIYSWIRDPHRFQPNTLMPRFRLRDEEVRDLAAYLAAEQGQVPEGFAGSAAAPDPALVGEGRRLFERRGCYSCHALEGFPPLARIGPKLTAIGDRVLEPLPLVARGILPTLPNWLFTKLSGPERVLASARMPTFGFAEDEAAAVSVALLSLRAREVPPGLTSHDPVQPPYVPQGDFGALVRRYRCLSCHTLGGSGHRTTTGAPLSTVALDRIGSQLRRDYLEAYLQKPIAVRVNLKERMPHLNIAPEEARILADHLSTVMLDDTLRGSVPADPGTLEQGRKLYEKRGCAGCHIAGQQGGFVGPDLNGSGARLQPGWSVAFLLEPERFKPGTLQPDYSLTRAEAEALTAYVMSLPARKGKAAAP
jgi:sulfur oxidation c-type cytochrome SoxX